jgi:hypothetical protein
MSTVTIAAGKAVSTPLDLTSAAVTMVIAPAEWTPANITFLVSIDGLISLIWGCGIWRGNLAGSPTEHRAENRSILQAICKPPQSSIWSARQSHRASGRIKRERG